MEPLYITSDGKIQREGNTIYFVTEREKRSFPIQNLKEIVCFGEVSLTSGAISYLLKRGVPVHFFNRYGYYHGSLFPRFPTFYGEIVVKQAEHYLDKEKRLYISSQIVEGLRYNILKNLRYYRKRGKDVEGAIEAIEAVDLNVSTPTQMFNREAQIWSRYYGTFDEIFSEFPLVRRGFHPPINEMNALISFGNGLLYVTTLSEIFHTPLYPGISYLHEPEQRRFSLALDIADIFKPVVVERILANLINNRMIKHEDFRIEGGYYLKGGAKRRFLEVFNERMDSTVYDRKLKRYVSYRYLIRYEGFKLVKHLMGRRQYRSFRRWW